MYKRQPVIFITGSSSLKRHGSGGFKEIDDVAIAAPLTKYSASVTDEIELESLLIKLIELQQMDIQEQFI